MDPLHELHFKARAFEMFAESCEHVVGYYMSGSYAMNFINPHSDLDPVFITANGKKAAVEKELAATGVNLENCDICIYTHKEFKNLDTRGTSGMGSCRYDFVHVRARLDRTGDIQATIDLWGRLSEEERKLLGEGHLDAYINAFYRSLKASRENWQFAPHLEAAQSVWHALDFLFASEGRITPYPKYLEWELRTHPLDFVISSDYLLKLTGGILNNIDVKSQVKLFDAITAKARRTGFSHIVDAWEGKPERMAMLFR